MDINTFGPILGVVVVIGLTYFIIVRGRNSKDKPSGSGGGGKTTPPKSKH